MILKILKYLRGSKHYGNKPNPYAYNLKEIGTSLDEFALLERLQLSNYRIWHKTYEG
jgi:hypothetical protein